MAEPSITSPRTVQMLNYLLSQIAAASDRLDAGCSSTLQDSDLKAAYRVVQPLLDIALKLQTSKSLKLDEALVFHKVGVSELLLSLLRRIPWAAMLRESETLQSGLDLVPLLLRCLRPFLCAAGSVRRSQQTAAYADMSKRCPSQARLRRPGCCACFLPNQKTMSRSSCLLCQDLHSTEFPVIEQIRGAASVLFHG